MSNGALPKNKLSTSSLNKKDARLQDSGSEFSFELKAKPKLTCIPENCSKMFKDLRKPQSPCCTCRKPQSPCCTCRKPKSLNTSTTTEVPDKSWSVLFIGSKTNLQV